MRSSRPISKGSPALWCFVVGFVFLLFGLGCWEDMPDDRKIYWMIITPIPFAMSIFWWALTPKKRRSRRRRHGARSAESE